jgi:hypothetical protein
VTPGGPCIPASTTRIVEVSFVAPEDVTSITAEIEYADDRLSLPANPAGRVRHNPAGTRVTVIGASAALQVRVSTGGIAASFSSGRLLTVEFDNCEGAPAAAGDFSCVVSDCRNISRPIQGCTCSVALQ